MEAGAGTVPDIADEALPLLPADGLPPPRLPELLGFWADPGLAVIAPAGKLVAAAGALDDALGDGGDWVDPDCAIVGAANKARPPANARAGALTSKDFSTNVLPL